MSSETKRRINNSGFAINRLTITNALVYCVTDILIFEGEMLRYFYRTSSGIHQTSLTFIVGPCVTNISGQHLFRGVGYIIMICFYATDAKMLHNIKIKERINAFIFYSLISIILLAEFLKTVHGLLKI